MKTQPQTHSYVKKGLWSFFVVGALSWNAALGMAEGVDEKHRIDLFQGNEHRGKSFVEGEITRVQGAFVGKDFSQMKDQRYTVETPSGETMDLQLKGNTQKSDNIFLGDYVQASVGKDGFVQTVQKVERNNTSAKNSTVHRQITGTVQRMDGHFLFIKNGERTEILHFDGQSTLEGNIREGSTVVAHLGDAGYAVKIQEFQGNSVDRSK